MSGSWSGGKGDKSRVKNFQSYWNSPLWNKSSRKALFLDDIRDPNIAYLWNDNFNVISPTQREFRTVVEVSGIPNASWTVVRSWEEFVTYIDTVGIPDVVSFDNDLVTEDKLNKQELDDQFKMTNWQTLSFKTGAHCAQYLIEKCKETKSPLPVYYIHTANKNGYKIIKELFENANL